MRNERSFVVERHSKTVAGHVQKFRENGDNGHRPDRETVVQVETLEERDEGSFHVRDVHERLRGDCWPRSMRSVGNAQRARVRGSVLARNNEPRVEQLRCALLRKRLLRQCRWIARLSNANVPKYVSTLKYSREYALTLHAQQCLASRVNHTINLFLFFFLFSHARSLSLLSWQILF